MKKLKNLAGEYSHGCYKYKDFPHSIEEALEQGFVAGFKTALYEIEKEFKKALVDEAPVKKFKEIWGK